MGSLDFVILRPNAVAASNIGPGDSHSPGPNPKPARWLEKGKKKTLPRSEEDEELATRT